MQAREILWTEPEARRKPKGGFSFISVPQLCMVWWAYREKHITLYELRVWFACRELIERRCKLPKGQKPEYRLDEIKGLVGGRGGRLLRSALKKLQAIGLIRWSDSKLELVTSPDELRVDDLSGFFEMLSNITNKRRPVPVPRRLVKLIAGGARRGVIATLLGHFIRCLYYKKRDQKCHPSGFIKATWIADVFGVDERNIRIARRHLISLGVLIPHNTPQRCQNRIGPRFEVNLLWDRPDKAVDNHITQGEENTNTCTESSAPNAQKCTESSALCLNKKLLPTVRTRNQKPASGRRSGFLVGSVKKKRPTLKHVVQADLTTTARLFELYEQAVGEGDIGQGERSRLLFVSAAEHARTIGSTNAPGLFAWMIRNRKWEFITQDDEDAANRRIKEHLYGDSRRREPVEEPKAKKVELSADARLVQAVKSVAARTGFRGDAFHLLRREYPNWTRDRWDRGVSECEGARFERLRVQAAFAR